MVLQQFSYLFNMGSYWLFNMGVVMSKKEQEYLEINKKLETLDASPALDDWVSVEKELPKYEVYVLIYGYDGYKISYYTRTKQWSGYDGRYVTHWMPLPQPPKEAD